MGDAMIAEFLLQIFNEEEEERINRRAQFEELRLKRKVLRDTSNPFTLDPEYFRKHYRLTPEVALQLLDVLHNRIVVHRRNSAIPTHLQMLITLRFLTEGALQKGFAQDFNHPVSQTTASRCVTTVVNAIDEIANLFISFPSTQEERQRVQNDFQRTIRIPGIIGLVDGFIVTFTYSSENEEAFYNYREDTSMNVQMVADSNYLIRSIRCCPGSNNDRFVWQFSQTKEYMEFLRQDNDIVQQEGYYYILGDSGYTPSPILLTPILNAAEGTPAHTYTSEHVSTRCKVEQTIGILSNVWRAISRSRKMQYDPEKVSKIINACAVLHNFRRKHSIIDEIDEIEEHAYDGVELEDQDDQHNRDYQAGIAERNRLLLQFY